MRAPFGWQREWVGVNLRVTGSELLLLVKINRDASEPGDSSLSYFYHFQKCGAEEQRSSCNSNVKGHCTTTTTTTAIE